MANRNLELIPLYEWGMFTEPRPSVIAGPCSAESLEQMMETAKGYQCFPSGNMEAEDTSGMLRGCWIGRVEVDAEGKEGIRIEDCD